MKQDRELLELAAKAAGIEIDPIDAAHEPGQWFVWNPLTDDGDALRLTVKLGIKVMPYPIYSDEKHSVIASCKHLAPPNNDDDTYVGPEVVEVYGGDPLAATRRAIVRAAAAIGEAMP